MKIKERFGKRHLKVGPINDKRGVAPVISTIIISGALLIILVVASFVSVNILELQMASTEFEEAKMNMSLLDEVVQDVALRRGSGGYVQFNQRTGGINIIEETRNISITIGGSLIYVSPPLVNLDYRGGSLVSTADSILRGSNSLIVKGLNSTLGYLRVEAGQGAWMKLDYERIRIDEMGTLVVNGTTHNFIGIVFIRLEKGSMGGVDSVSVKVQNVGVNTSSYIYDGGTVSIQANLGSMAQNSTFVSSAQKSVVTFVEVQVKISTA